MSATDRWFKERDRMVTAMIGEEGLALVAGAADFLEKLIAGVPEHYALRLQVDRHGDRDEVEIEISRENHGSATFRLWWNDGQLELVPVNAIPSAF